MYKYTKPVYGRDSKPHTDRYARLFKIIIIVAIIVFVLSSVLFFMFPEQQVRIHFLMNSDELELLGRSYFETLDTEELERLENIEQTGTIYPGEYHVVQFSHDAFGFKGANSLYGYYYSPKDMPVTFNNLDTELTEISDNSWEWSIHTNNYGRTVKLADNWYYYEANLN